MIANARGLFKNKSKKDGVDTFDTTPSISLSHFLQDVNKKLSQNNNFCIINKKYL